eukprot:m.30791 g.30791  ORF g.30791 m.30791 type:complete len:385 (+) comp14638_c0_seq1:105-1259(+)
MDKATVPVPLPWTLSPHIKTPEALMNLLRSEPIINTSSAAVWKSPDLPGWSLSIRTPDLTALLDGPLFNSTDTVIREASESTNNTATNNNTNNNHPRTKEANPFSKSFSRMSSNNGSSFGSKTSSRKTTPSSSSSSHAVPEVPEFPSSKIKSGRLGALAQSGAKDSPDPALDGVVPSNTPKQSSHTTDLSTLIARKATQVVASSTTTPNQTVPSNTPVSEFAVASALATMMQPLPAPKRPELPEIPPHQPPRTRTKPKKRKSDKTHYDNPEEEKKAKRRERNRIAAANCRQRKLDKENELRAQLDGLWKEHGTLFSQLNKLQTKLMGLKRETLEHTKNGCHVAVTPSPSILTPSTGPVALSFPLSADPNLHTAATKHATKRLDE